jgi:two-component system LytT family response regulator
VEHIIEAEHVSRRYPLDHNFVMALDDVTLRLERGEFLAIAGPSGTGKSTLLAVDAVFLDIEMPGINGFELLARLPEQPLVIFTTAYDQYALKAFEVNSIDFLLKPVDQEQLARALRKLERLRSAGKPKWMRQPEMQALLHELAASLRPSPQDYPERIASRVGERTHLVELSAVTHFFARDKLMYAVAAGATPVWTRALRSSSGGWTRMKRLKRFIRIHRAILGWRKCIRDWADR